MSLVVYRCSEYILGSILRISVPKQQSRRYEYIQQIDK